MIVEDKLLNPIRSSPIIPGLRIWYSLHVRQSGYLLLLQVNQPKKL